MGFAKGLCVIIGLIFIGGGLLMAFGIYNSGINAQERVEEYEEDIFHTSWEDTQYEQDKETVNAAPMAAMGSIVLSLIIGLPLIYLGIRRPPQPQQPQTVVIQQPTAQQPAIQQQIKIETPKTQDEILKDWYSHIDRETNKVWDKCLSCGKYTFLLAEEKGNTVDFYCQECGVKFTLER